MAPALYETASGWSFNDYGPTYAGIRAPGSDEEVGGLDATKPPVPGGPLVLLYSVTAAERVVRTWLALGVPGSLAHLICSTRPRTG